MAALLFFAEWIHCHTSPFSVIQPAKENLIQVIKFEYEVYDFGYNNVGDMIPKLI